MRWEDSVSSYDLSTGESLWTVSNVPSCSDVGRVDSLTVRTDVVVAATTCFEQPEGEESVASTLGQDFSSELVGLSPETGEELWRTEHSVGRMPSNPWNALSAHARGTRGHPLPFRRPG
ncbi:PQQ-binding-like beta-propeller repeat protein [Nocardiopsis eucommiae]|uniref:PQQ-binding-like beta-propeller repeat protein n=1 Tax=Nocardiopsis eucommiae TaxID=2831970 RepID=A0A975L8G9_9ACTN|nr:PQQ-binding-like beta-propeller repeat protein [Nocardiopsis eucommiae]